MSNETLKTNSNIMNMLTYLVLACSQLKGNMMWRIAHRLIVYNTDSPGKAKEAMRESFSVEIT